MLCAFCWWEVMMSVFKTIFGNAQHPLEINHSSRIHFFIFSHDMGCHSAHWIYASSWHNLINPIPPHDPIACSPSHPHQLPPIPSPPTYSRGYLQLSISLPSFGTWKETRVLSFLENMQTPHSQHQRSGLKPRLWSYKTIQWQVTNGLMIFLDRSNCNSLGKQTRLQHCIVNI